MVSASSARVDNPVDHQSHDGGFGSAYSLLDELDQLVHVRQTVSVRDDQLKGLDVILSGLNQFIFKEPDPLLKRAFVVVILRDHERYSLRLVP